MYNQSINQTDYFIVRLKVDQRAGQRSLPHLGITSASEMTYIVSSGALNSTHSLTHLGITKTEK